VPVKEQEDTQQEGDVIIPCRKLVDMMGRLLMLILSAIELGGGVKVKKVE